MPAEEIEILSKDVEIDGEIYTLSSNIKYKTNCITETSTSISVDEDGEIDTNTSWSESSSFILSHGCTGRNVNIVSVPGSFLSESEITKRLGMNQHIIDNYYTNVGCSYYSSREFSELMVSFKSSFTPISRFGIGILSC